MWTLVFIWLYNGEPEVKKVGVYPDMYQCFKEFDNLYHAMLPEERYGIRMTCIHGDTNGKS